MLMSATSMVHNRHKGQRIALSKPHAAGTAKSSQALQVLTTTKNPDSLIVLFHARGPFVGYPQNRMEFSASRRTCNVEAMVSRLVCWGVGPGLVGHGRVCPGSPGGPHPGVSAQSILL